MESENKPSPEVNGWSLMFKYSLLIYPITIIIALFFGIFVGIDSGWAMPAWSNGHKMYGTQAIISYLVILPVAFYWIYIPVLVFQIGYIIFKILYAIWFTYFKKLK